MITRIKPPSRITVLEGHRLMLQQKKEENVKLTLTMRKTGVAKNIVYIKKTKKGRNTQTTLDNFVQGKSKISQIIEEEGLKRHKGED